MAWYDKETKGMIVDTNSLRILIFQFNPMVIKDKYKPVYTDHAIPGLTFPRSQWGHGSNRTLDFTLEWFFQERHSLDVRNNCEFLQSFLFPNYTNSSKLVKAPKLLLFKFGQMYNGYFEMRKCDVTFDTLWESRKLLARKARCDITLKFAELDAPMHSVTNLSPVMINQANKSAGAQIISDVGAGILDESSSGFTNVGQVNYNPHNVQWEGELKVTGQVVGFGDTLGM